MVARPKFTNIKISFRNFFSFVAWGRGHHGIAIARKFNLDQAFGLEVKSLVTKAYGLVLLGPTALGYPCLQGPTGPLAWGFTWAYGPGLVGPTALHCMLVGPSGLHLARGPTGPMSSRLDS